MAEDEPFLRRWARRKAAVQDAEPAPLPADLPDEPAHLTPEPHATANTEAKKATDGEDEQPTIDPADLPDIDSLGNESDFSVFMQDGVPEQLRNRALRRLWRLDPAFASVDGLLEYDDDFTDAALAVEAIQTVYKIGKGMRGDDEADAAEDATDTAASDEDVRRDTTKKEEETLNRSAKTTSAARKDDNDADAAEESQQAPKEKNRDS